MISSPCSCIPATQEQLIFKLTLSISSSSGAFIAQRTNGTLKRIAGYRATVSKSITETALSLRNSTLFILHRCVPLLWVFFPIQTMANFAQPAFSRPINAISAFCQPVGFAFLNGNCKRLTMANCENLDGLSKSAAFCPLNERQTNRKPYPPALPATDVLLPQGIGIDDEIGQSPWITHSIVVCTST